MIDLQAERSAGALRGEVRLAGAELRREKEGLWSTLRAAFLTLALAIFLFAAVMSTTNWLLLWFLFRTTGALREGADRAVAWGRIKGRLALWGEFSQPSLWFVSP